jgi:MFS family permease
MADTKVPVADEKFPEDVSEMSIRDATDASSIYIDPEKEKACLRKFDKYFMPQAFIFLLLNYLDRSNLGNAVIFGFSTEIGLKGNEFGNINTLFFVTYVLFEIPWVMAVKRFGPNIVLGAALTSWSVVTLGTGFVQNYHQAIACRMLLGACEAGVAPGLAYIFSTIYPQESVAKRIAMTNFANATSGAFGGLIAYGIQMMGEQRGISGEYSSASCRPK